MCFICTAIVGLSLISGWSVWQITLCFKHIVGILQEWSCLLPVMNLKSLTSQPLCACNKSSVFNEQSGTWYEVTGTAGVWCQCHESIRNDSELPCLSENVRKLPAERSWSKRLITHFVTSNCVTLSSGTIWRISVSWCLSLLGRCNQTSPWKTP